MKFLRYFELSILSLSFIFALCAQAESNSCKRLFKIKTPSLKTYLQMKGTKLEGVPSLIYLGFNDSNQIEFLKRPGMDWSSTALLNGSFTPQGDPRRNIYFFGEKLAANLKFEFSETARGFVYKAPSARFLEEIILKLNPILVNELKFPPIIFQPIQAEFITAKEALQLSTRARPPVVSLFPYADFLSELAAHEADWHVGAIAFPNKFHERANLVDVAVRNLVNRLKSSKLPKVMEVIQQIEATRVFENDIGNAETFSRAAVLREGVFRKTEKIESYEKVMELAKLSESTPIIEELTTSIGLLTKCYLNPSEAALVTLIFEAGLRPQLFKFSSETILDTRAERYQRKLSLSKDESAQYIKWIQQYMATDEYLATLNEANENPFLWALDLIQSMDQRIVQLNKAFAILKKREKLAVTK